MDACVLFCSLQDLLTTTARPHGERGPLPQRLPLPMTATDHAGEERRSGERRTGKEREESRRASTSDIPVPFETACTRGKKRRRAGEEREDESVRFPANHNHSSSCAVPSVVFSRVTFVQQRYVHMYIQFRSSAACQLYYLSRTLRLIVLSIFGSFTNAGLDKLYTVFPKIPFILMRLWSKQLGEKSFLFIPGNSHY